MDLVQRWRMLRQKAPGLMAVTKGQPVTKILPLLQAGHRLFGESRLQEALLKWPALRQDFPDSELHFIGRLQTNKVAQVLQLFDAIQSIDRLKLVDDVVAYRALWRPNFRVFIQVNLADEPQKGGCSLRDFPALLAACQTRKLPLCGVMTVPPADQEPTPYFQQLKNLADANGLCEISMGMSRDYQKAIAVGATLIRLGTALFENRQ